MAEKRNGTKDAIFSKCANLVCAIPSACDEDLRTLSSIIASSARPSSSALKMLSQKLGDSFKTMCLRAVTVAANPFISGTVLATTVSAAASTSPEGQKRKLNGVGRAVDLLLLEVFERLPQTVHGFGGGSECCEILEPKIRGEEASESEKLVGYSIGNKGPLTLMFEKGETRDTYSSVPLIIDFMSYRFTQGLPDLRDTYGVVRDRETQEWGEKGVGDREEHDKGAKELRVLSPIDWFTRKGVREVLRGDDAKVPSLTVLPGAQYVVAGLAARPNDFYEVPVMRMALDVVVYLAMVAALSYFVLYQHVDGPLSWEEGTFGTVFILVSGRRRATVMAHYM